MNFYIILLLAGLAVASHIDCQCEAGCGPGSEQSYLTYGGRFKGGARQFLPVYQRFVSSEHECKVKGGCGAHPHHDHKPHKYQEKYEHEWEHRYKRHAEYRQPCKCEKGCGPGYEQSFLKYGGHFKGGALKSLPVYERETSEEYECKVKGGCGAHHHHHHKPHNCHEKYEHGLEHRYKRHAEYRQPCKCEKGCGPGYEQSFLGYGGRFHGGSRTLLPVYQRITSEEHECKVKGGCGARPHHHHHHHHHHEECPCKHREHEEYSQRYKRHSECDKECRCEKGCGPGYEQSFLGYGGRFKGGALKSLPVYERETSEENTCIVKGGCGAREHGHKRYHEEYDR